MSTKVVGPFAEGFRGSFRLLVQIVATLIVVISAFVSHSSLEINKGHDQGRSC